MTSKIQDPKPKTQDPETILVTGGAGFIGSNLIEYFLENTDYNIRVLDNLSVGKTKYTKKIVSQFGNVTLKLSQDQSAENPQSTDATKQVQEITTQQLKHSTNNQNPTTVTVIKGDIRNKEVVELATNDVDALVHLAAITGVPASVENPVKTYNVNVNGTQNLLEACRDNGVEKFVLASSNAAVGEKEPPIHEEMVPEPISPYGSSKLAGESLCKAYSPCYGMKANALRFSNVYGPYSDHKDSVVMKFIRKAKTGETLPIYGDGEQTRDFIHAADIAQAVTLTLDSDLSGEVFQVGTGKETKIKELAKIIQSLTNNKTQEPEIVHRDPRQGDIYKNYTDPDKMQNMLGFGITYFLEKGLERVFNNTVSGLGN